MILTDTKISTTAYCRNHLGYEVTCSEARSISAGGYKGGNRLATRERPIGWGIESTRHHRPNVVSCELVSGIIWTPLFGSYLSLSTLEHLPDLEESLKHFKGPISLGGLNMELKEARRPRSHRVADIIVKYGLIDLVCHFRQRSRFQNLKTWSQVRQGTALWSICDYILGPY